MIFKVCNPMIAKWLFVSALCSGLSLSALAQGSYDGTYSTLLSKFPAKNPTDLNANMLEIAKLQKKGYLNLISGLAAPGKGNNAQLEYAIGGFSAYVTQTGMEKQRAMSVKAYCEALSKLTDPQVKSFIISQLELTAKDDAIPTLQIYLTDDFLSDVACRSLVKINTTASRSALLKALPKANGKAKLNVIKALGDSKVKASVSALNALATSEDKQVSKMSFYALAYIADPSSEPIFSGAAEKAAYQFEDTDVVASYLVYTDQLLKAGNQKLAGEIGRKILANTSTKGLSGTRTNAVRILIDVNSSNAAAHLAEASKGADLNYFAAVLKFSQPHINEGLKSFYGLKLRLAQTVGRDYLAEQKLLVYKDLYARFLSVSTTQEVQPELAFLKKYIDSMKPGPDFVPLFNGKDLTGWKGLVGDPIKRAKMDATTLAAEQVKADAAMRDSWQVVDGELRFMSHGDNLATVKKYGDFEMLVDWKIIDDKKGEGDAGIYLRGTPQVQIWDNARVNVGAQVGSGGLYNNQKNVSKPLVVADNKLDEWNTFRIIMKADRVTVYLNGVLVTDNVILENYWDRNLPIFAEEQIELQAHGSPVAYRDIYIKELPRARPFELSKKEKKEGYKVLFDGTNMHNWMGNVAEYVTENGDMALIPKKGKGSGGNLYTKEEFSDFTLRFEFQLTEGANNGLGIRSPTEGDAAYVGIELQILDNEAPMYKDLKEYQYHGSIYGTLPAKRGHLKPVGEWNYQEVVVNGPKIKVVLNGTVILNADITDARKNGTPDKQQHPGLLRDSGHIAFLGHGSPLKFRNIRIKDLSKPKK
ncbi:MAG: DUF1080 domain-containing protein [Pedobacter sp.]|nr:MAG: DUF1080 domain-containing protein [Pedobacter sp.]